MYKGPIVSISSSSLQWRLIPVFVLAIALSGCATTQSKTQGERMETRVTELEKNLQAKDAEIVDLQYQVKDLSSKVEGAKTSESDQASSGAQSASNSIGQSQSSDQLDVSSTSPILRVKVNPEKVQRALKSAGVYTGPVDGKIGSGTRAAIVEFQKSHGLKADGVLGRKTWEELKTYLK